AAFHPRDGRAVQRAYDPLTEVGAVIGASAPRRAMASHVESGAEPPLRHRIVQEEVEEQLRSLHRAARRERLAVRLEVAALPGQAVRARRGSVGPEIRAPRYPRRDAGAVVDQADARVAVVLRAIHARLLHLVGDDPAVGEAGLVRERLGVEAGRAVAAVDAAGEIDDLHV